MNIDANSVFYAFHQDLQPVATVESGRTLSIATKDCFSNLVKQPEDFRRLDWDQVNPATGPIAVSGAQAGDVLKVDIHEISIADTGVMCVVPGAGVLGDRITESEAKVFQIADGTVHFNEQVKLPVRKMIGVIGVAPADKAVPNGVPGRHGGNMDNRVITEGATVYFPVQHEGALFGLGDVHGAMGDGEVCVCGLEVAARVRLTLSVLKGYSLEHPFLENETDYYTIVSGDTLDGATHDAVDTMAELLCERTGLPLSEVTMLMSLAGHTEIAQVVDPQVTVRFRMPRSVLLPYFKEFFPARPESA